MITAQELQEILKVEDNRIILYGYTFQRETVEWYFEHCHLVRVTTDGDRVIRYLAMKEVTQSHLTGNIKRFYRNGTNSKLRDLFETFRGGLWETSGGTVPHGWPCHYPPPEGES